MHSQAPRTAVTQQGGRLYVARPRDPALLFDFMVRRGFRAITKPSEMTTQTELRITAVVARLSLSLGSSDNHHWQASLIQYP